MQFVARGGVDCCWFEVLYLGVCAVGLGEVVGVVEVYVLQFLYSCYCQGVVYCHVRGHGGFYEK